MNSHEAPQAEQDVGHTIGFASTRNTALGFTDVGLKQEAMNPISGFSPCRNAGSTPG
jgi:hypothetical protein